MAEPVNFPSGFLPVDPRTKNIAGFNYVPEVTKAGNEYETASKEAMDALRERYSTPNWGKVAAAFGRPHLGGAFEALGDVGNVLGEHLEQARDAKVNLAQMRAQLAAYKYPAAQQAEAQRIFEESPGELSPANAARIAAYTGGIGASSSQEGRTQQGFDIERALQDWKSGMQEVDFHLKYSPEVVAKVKAITGPRPVVSKPSSSIPPAGGEGANVSTKTPPLNASPTPQGGKKKVGFIPGIDMERIEEAFEGSDTPPEMQNVIRQAEIQNGLTVRNELINTLGNQRTSYTGVFKDAKDAYKSFADPSLSNLFAIGQGPQIGDLIVKALEKIPVGTIIADAFKQAQPLSNDQKAKLESAIVAGAKAVGQFASANQLSNPTDAIREIEQYIPNFRTAPQETLLRAFAVMGSDALYKAQQFPTFQSYINTKGNDARFWQSSESIRKLQKEASQRSDSVLRDPIKVKTQDGGFTFATPKFFDQDIGGEAKEKASSSSTATERPQELQTASGRLVKVDGKWARVKP